MTPETETERACGRAGTHTPLGWLTVSLNFAYAVFGYYGFAAPPGGEPTQWWHGRAYLLGFESMGAYGDNPTLGAFVFGVPALVVCLMTFLATRSVIARALSLSLALTSLLLAATGFAAATPWLFFGWRLTVIIVLTSFSLAAAIVAPLLVERWLRLPWAARFGIYLPLFFGAMAAVRGATGTDEQMRFMVSPWPVFTTFGLGIGALIVSGFLLSIAIGMFSLSRGTLDTTARLGLLGSLSVPSVWIALGVSQSSVEGAFLSTLIAGVFISICWIYGRHDERKERLRVHGFHTGLGATLVFLPILAGQALAARDFSVNRYVRGPEVVAALQQHIEAEAFYPETLEDLVAAGYFDQTPTPRVGFEFLEQIGLVDKVKYRYSEYGSSFVIEFDSSDWVQCAYSGNYTFEDEELEEDAYEEEADWTCQGNSPTLVAEAPRAKDAY